VAHRGHLRVIPPDDAGTPDKTSVQTLDPPLRLVTLSSPKPSQVLVYLGDQDGKPHTTKPSPDDGYPAEPGKRRLRGRKVYLTHAEVLDGAERYWTPQTVTEPEPLIIGGRTRYREYQQQGVQATDRVSTLVSQWIKVGTTFRVDLVVDNLDATELGALLWLLTLPDGVMLKLGLGKPLGFGAVRVDVDWDRTSLFTGERLRDRYRTLARTPAPTARTEVEALAEQYDELMREHLPDVRSAFLTAARGIVGVPVHYPRCGEHDRAPGAPSLPRPTTYDWWVENNKARIPLGTLTEPGTLPLPYHVSKQQTAGANPVGGRAQPGTRRRPSDAGRRGAGPTPGHRKGGPRRT
jgi:hypothetical protein